MFHYSTLRHDLSVACLLSVSDWLKLSALLDRPEPQAIIREFILSQPNAAQFWLSAMFVCSTSHLNSWSISGCIADFWQKWTKLLASCLGSNRQYVSYIFLNSLAFLHKADLQYQPQFQPVVPVCGGAAFSHSLAEEQ